jgi:hypothetical protein
MLLPTLVLNANANPVVAGAKMLNPGPFFNFCQVGFYLVNQFFGIRNNRGHVVFICAFTLQANFGSSPALYWTESASFTRQGR